MANRILTGGLLAASVAFLLMVLLGGGGVMMGIFGGLGLFVAVVSLLGDAAVKRLGEHGGREEGERGAD